MRRALVLLALLPLAAAAQPEERLPELTPREFEIQGELQISLPDLQRQPLRGFAPPPRTYVVPADRQPHIAPYAQPVEALPESPLPEPAPPAVVAVRPRVAQIDLALGRYLGRLARLTVGGAGFGLDLAYDGHAGFEPLEQREGFKAGADAFAARAGYRSRGPLRAGLAADFAYDRYRLTGADLAALLDRQPERAGRTFGLEARLESVQQTPFHVEARFASSRFEVLQEIWQREAASNPWRFAEARLEAAAAVEPGPLVLEATGALSGLGGEGLGAGLAAYGAGGALRLLVGDFGRLDLGARFLGYTAGEMNGGGSSLNVGPIVRFEAALAPSARLFARSAPRLVPRSSADLFRENPYAVAQPLLAPELHLFDAEAGLELQGEAFRLVAYGGGRYSPVHLYFEREAATGLFAAHYSRARLFRAGGDLTLYAPGGVSLSLGAEGRFGALTGQGGRDIPYLAPLAGRLSASLPFAAGRGLLQLTGTAEGARPTEAEGERADAWAELSAEAHLRLARGLGVLLRGENLAGRAERWPGFPRPPALVMAGIRAGW